jgi:hypothetical protein
MLFLNSYLSTQFGFFQKYFPFLNNVLLGHRIEGLVALHSSGFTHTHTVAEAAVEA